MPDDPRIWSKVEELRERFPCLRSDKLPLDLIIFVDLDLRLDLIPDDGLSREFGADAAIKSDFTGIYVDGETFDMIDSAPEWRLNRLRFSLAHEVGHLFLHREVFEQADIRDIDHYLAWLNEHGGRKYQLEREANEFAGRLLVPVEILRGCFDLMQPIFDTTFGRHAWINDDALRTKAAERLAPRFGVHWKTIATRFDREGIWPSPY
ncbi:MAG: ImmA/IrrE family metallo-endopeptidase [Verrucomicrobia bacterium]|nr:ImmA/IrrE family metallo-endopeptidase [Verrucomicrobiota bacterium]